MLPEGWSGPTKTTVIARLFGVTVIARLVCETVIARLLLSPKQGAGSELTASWPALVPAPGRQRSRDYDRSDWFSL